MRVIEFFKEWLHNNEQKKKFYEMWDEEWSDELTPSNNCNPYHKKVAYELFLMQQRIEELEKKIA